MIRQVSPKLKTYIKKAERAAVVSLSKTRTDNCDSCKDKGSTRHFLSESLRSNVGVVTPPLPINISPGIQELIGDTIKYNTMMNLKQ